MPALNPVLTNLPEYPIETLRARKAEVLARGQKVYDFGVGDPIDPMPSWIGEAMMGGLPRDSGYPTFASSQPVRAAIAGYLQRRFGVTLDPDTQVLPTSGSKEAVFFLPFTVIDRTADDNVVLYPDPGYPAYLRGALFAGAEAVPIELTGDCVQRAWELDEGVLKRARMMWINSPNNPTGSVMSLEDLRRTWELCQKYDILLCSDECYADLYDGAPPPSLLEVATKDVVVLNSLSKRNGMTGYRAGFLAGDAKWIKVLKDFRANPGVAPSDMVNAAAAAAWADDAHAVERREMFNARKRVLQDWFEELGLEVAGSQSSLYLWVKAPAGKDGLQWCLELLDLGIVAYPGHWLGVTDAGAEYVRFAVCPSLEATREAVAHWRAALGA